MKRNRSVYDPAGKPIDQLSLKVANNLQPVLDRLTRSRPGPEQLARFEDRWLFRSHGHKHGGRAYDVQDFAQGRAVPLQSPLADERRFIEASGCFWSYRFERIEAPIADPTALERQIAASTFVAQGHGLAPR